MEITAGLCPRGRGALGLIGFALGIVLLVPAIALFETVFFEVGHENALAFMIVFTVTALMGILLISCGLYMFLGRRHFYMKLTQSDLIVSDYYRVLTIPFSRIVSADKYNDCVIVKTDDGRTVYLSYYSSLKELSDFASELNNRIERCTQRRIES